MSYRICTKCRPNHYEDCNVCFGWGIYNDGKKTPVAAHDLYIVGIEDKTIKCPECNSDIHGIPRT